MEVSLWASDSLVGDPVALDMDDSRAAWITATNRRRSSAPDIRNHPDWQLASLKMQDGEDRRAFLRREPAPEYNEQNSSWLTDYNDDGVHDWRDLTVQEEKIYRINNTTGSGHANRMQLFYRGFSDEVSEVAGALPPRRRSLRRCSSGPVAHPRYARRQHRDRAEALSHGYGVHIGLSEHGMSGLTMDPDGRIYWSIGDHGFNVEDEAGKRWAQPGSA